MNVIANFLLYFLMLYLAGGALAMLIMVYRCRKAWSELDEPVAFRKMMFVSFWLAGSMLLMSCAMLWVIL